MLACVLALPLPCPCLALPHPPQPQVDKVDRFCRLCQLCACRPLPPPLPGPLPGPLLAADKAPQGPARPCKAPQGPRKPSTACQDRRLTAGRRACRACRAFSLSLSTPPLPLPAPAPLPPPAPSLPPLRRLREPAASPTGPAPSRAVRVPCHAMTCHAMPSHMSHTHPPPPRTCSKIHECRKIYKVLRCMHACMHAPCMRFTLAQVKLTYLLAHAAAL